MRLPCDEIFARKVEVWKRSGMQVEENLHSSQDISQEADMTTQPVVLGLTLEAYQYAAAPQPNRRQCADVVLNLGWARLFGSVGPRRFAAEQRRIDSLWLQPQVTVPQSSQAAELLRHRVLISYRVYGPYPNLDSGSEIVVS